MQIDLDWLNRIGIILNFLAGFMLAPDLIDEQKREILENYIDKMANFTSRIIRKRIGVNILDELSNTNIKWVLYFFTFFTWFTTILLLSYFKLGGKPVDLLSGIVLMCFTLFILIMSVFITLLLIPVFLVEILVTIENLAAKNNTFTSLLTVGGIIFFIVGNLFQFIASFK